MAPSKNVEQKLVIILKRLDNMETKIDKFNKKFEEMFEDLNEKYDELKSALDNKPSVNLFKRLKLRVEQLEQERANAKQDKVAREAYSERLNLLVHGIEELIEEVWETKQSTLEKFDQFLENGLKILLVTNKSNRYSSASTAASLQARTPSLPTNFCQTKQCF